MKLKMYALETFQNVDNLQQNYWCGPLSALGENMLFKLSICLVFILTSAFTCVAKCTLLEHANPKSVLAVFPVWICLGWWGKTEERSHGSASGYRTAKKILYPRKT